VIRTAVVTGVSGGIGRAVADRFAIEGWRVVGVDLVDPAPDQQLDRFEPADLASDGGVADLWARLGDIAEVHALVNNAAVQLDKPIVETTDDEWSQVIDTNLRSAFQAIREARPVLAAARGAIVNISSVHAVATSVNVAAYATSKAALVALTRAAALELAPDGIRCNAVLPGAVDTPMLRAGLDRRPHVDGAAGNLRSIAERTPLGFVARPDQIAPSVVHLADSDASPYITGQTLIVDGGATARLSTE
jgi:NAD(P)-dependent dehydrogenase (short-subunit alcohol dehydrogenase family)